MSPYVLRYECSKEQLDEFIANNFSFGVFKGNVAIHKYTDFFELGSFLKTDLVDPNCPTQYDEVGDPIPCDELTVAGSGSDGGGSTGNNSGTSSTGSSTGGSSSGGSTQETCTLQVYVMNCGGENSDHWHTYESCGDPSKLGVISMIRITCVTTYDLKVENDCPDCTNGTDGAVGVNLISDKCMPGYVKDSNGLCVLEEKDDCDTSKDDLKKVFPNASDDTLTKLAGILNKFGKDFGIDTKEKLQHFLAQAGHETGEFKQIGSTESLYYTTKDRLLEIFGKYFSETDTIKKRNPDKYLKNSSKVANYVYCCRMGNGDEASGDGYKYRGRGVFQLTGKDNYEDFKTFYNNKYDPDKDFLSSPDLLASNDTVAVISALWYYQKKVLDKLTVDNNTLSDDVTKKVNGGTNGKKHRKELYEVAKDSIKCN